MRKHFGNVFTTKSLDAIKPANIAEYELSEDERRAVRREIYRINKDGVRKFRTMRDGRYLLIWRII